MIRIRNRDEIKGFSASRGKLLDFMFHLHLAIKVKINIKCLIAKFIY